MTTRQAQIDVAAESIRLAYKVWRWFKTVITEWGILAAHTGQKSTKLKMKADLVAILISSILTTRPKPVLQTANALSFAPTHA